MIEAFGWVAAAIGIAANLPQLIRILRTGTSAGVSERLWQMAAGTTGAWCVHGYLVAAPQMQLPNAMMVIAALSIVTVVRRDRKQAVLPGFVLPLVVAVALSLVNVAFGALVFGIVIAIPQIYGQLSQFRELISVPDLSGVSGGYLSVFLLVQSMWFVFGMATTDWALRVCAGSMVVCCVLNLGVYLVRRSRAKSRVALAV